MADRPVVRHHRADGIASSASYSPCGLYRYRLRRRWGDGGQVTWIMLNPSTADETANDPTIERCERRSQALGYGGYTIVNLFAFRATAPAHLKAAPDPVGPGNLQAVKRAVMAADAVIAAWGAHGSHRDGHLPVLSILRRTQRPVFHLGLTADGHPRHPLYLSYEIKPTPWRP